jgi:hypothetical protein
MPLPTKLHKRSNMLAIPLIRVTDDSAQPNAWMRYEPFFDLERRDVFPATFKICYAFLILGTVQSLRRSSTTLFLGLRQRARYYSRFSCIWSEYRFHGTWTDYLSVDL